MVAAEYSLVEHHSAAAEREAREFGAEVDLGELERRRDLRGVAFITIDGETARDFDDAVFVERRKSGYVLWVAIADVSHYVTPGSALDRESRSRGTSVYFPERAFHMLPRALSENLCSLKPDVPRLSLVARMEFDRKGERESVEVMEAVIQSRRRATYEQIQAEHEANRRDPAWEFAAHFELYRTLRETRSARGSIDFDLPESEVRVEPDGEVLSITRRDRVDSHRLIEEFMIAANEAVTAWMMERRWPFVYRVHDVPATRRARALSEARGQLRHSRGDRRGGVPQGDRRGRFAARRPSRADHAEHGAAALDEAGGLQLRARHSLRPGVGGLYAFHEPDPALSRSDRASSAPARPGSGARRRADARSARA